MDRKSRTYDDLDVELKNALRKSPPKKNPNMSEAEYRMKYQGKESK